MRHRTLCGVALVLGLAACRSPGDPAAHTSLTSSSAASLALTRLRSDSIAFAVYSGITSPTDLVVRDSAGWSTLWQLVHANQDPVPPLPAIDFTREMILAVGLGTRSTGGYNVLLTAASEDSAGVNVQVVETSPGADCITTQALSQPVDLARAPRRDAPVRFSINRQVRDCGR